MKQECDKKIYDHNNGKSIWKKNAKSTQYNFPYKFYQGATFTPSSYDGRMHSSYLIA